MHKDFCVISYQCSIFEKCGACTFYQSLLYGKSNVYPFYQGPIFKIDRKKDNRIISGEMALRVR